MLPFGPQNWRKHCELFFLQRIRVIFQHFFGRGERFVNCISKASGFEFTRRWSFWLPLIGPISSLQEAETSHPAPFRRKAPETPPWKRRTSGLAITLTVAGAWEVCICRVYAEWSSEGAHPKGPKIEKIQDLEIFKRAAHQTPIFLWGILKVGIEIFQSRARLKISIEIEFFQSLGP